MARTPVFFVVGRRYTNRIGTYEVLNIQSSGMRVRYDDGKEQVFEKLNMQERIVRNVQTDQESNMPYAMQDDRNRSYFRAVGVLAIKGRIEAIVPPRAQNGFEGQYQEVKGRKPIPGKNMYYLHEDPNVDKWGTELRISFTVSPAEKQIMEQGLDVTMVSGIAADEYRINNNGFTWRLFRTGFCLGDQQAPDEIVDHVPDKYRDDFRLGLEV